MKREFLQNFKIGDQSLSKEAIDAILDENSRDISAAKAKFGDYETVKEQLAKANETIKSFEAMDIESVKKAAEEWEKKAKQAEKEADEKIAELEFNGLLNQAVATAKGRNIKAISALLDMDALKASKNREADIKAALERLKKDSAYLFEHETPPPYAAGTGTAPAGIPKEPTSLAGALKERYETKG